MSTPEIHEIFAIRYATLAGRRRSENFIFTDRHDAPMPMDYFVWAIVNPRRVIVVDTGFDRAAGNRRGRTFLREPREGLALIGIEAAAVKDVILTHLHYDHAGTLEHFPSARFHVQEREMKYATGRDMGRAGPAEAYCVGDVCEMLQRVFSGRAVFHDGDRDVAPGVSVHLVGGHTMGMQCVRVFTRRGWVVLASDASHFYENMEANSPFPIVYSMQEMVVGYQTLVSLAESRRHIIPGHDPLVMQRYPRARDDLGGAVVRLDAAPAD